MRLLVAALSTFSAFSVPAQAGIFDLLKPDTDTVYLYEDSLSLAGTVHTLSSDRKILKSRKIGFLTEGAQMNIDLRVGSQYYGDVRGYARMHISHAGRSKIFKPNRSFLNIQSVINASKYYLEDSVLASTQGLDFDVQLKVNKQLVNLNGPLQEERLQWCGYDCNNGVASGVACLPILGCYSAGGSYTTCKDLGYKKILATYDEYSGSIDATITRIVKKKRVQEAVPAAAFNSPFKQNVKITLERQDLSGCSTANVALAQSAATRNQHPYSVSAGLELDPVFGDPNVVMMPAPEMPEETEASSQF